MAPAGSKRRALCCLDRGGMLYREGMGEPPPSGRLGRRLPAQDLIRGGNRFSEKIMVKQTLD